MKKKKNMMQLINNHHKHHDKLNSFLSILFKPLIATKLIINSNMFVVVFVVIYSLVISSSPSCFVKCNIIMVNNNDTFKNFYHYTFDPSISSEVKLQRLGNTKINNNRHKRIINHKRAINSTQASLIYEEAVDSEIKVTNKQMITDLITSIGNENKNMTRPEMLELLLGPRKKTFSFVLGMGTVYFLILLCGILGNISTCLVIILNSNLHKNTNYYLFSLAVSDVLSLLAGLPTELYSIIVEAYPWSFGSVFCVIRSFVFETTTIASVLTILTFSFERWLHICRPMYAQKFSSGFKRALKIIVFIWVLSGALALPYLLTTGVYFEYDEYPESKTCSIISDHKEKMKTVIQLSVLFLFIVPMTLISIMYILIGITLWKSQKRHKLLSEGANNRKSDKSQNAKLNLISSNKKKKLCNEISNNYLNATKTYMDDSNVQFDSEIQENDIVLKKSTNIGNSNISIATNNNNNSSGTNPNNNNKIHLGNCQTNRITFTAEQKESRARQSRRDVVKMLFFVVLAFFICWAPYHCQRVITASLTLELTKSKFMMKLLEYLYYISGVSIYISSTLNPILYNLMSKRFRTAFKTTLHMICTCSFKNKSNYYANSAYANYKTTQIRYNFNSKNTSNLPSSHIVKL